MLLAIDAGNTNLTVGVFDGARAVARWRLRTVHEKTADEWGVKLRQLFEVSGIDAGKVDGLIVASVVPPIESTLAEMAPRYFGTQTRFVTSETHTGIRIRTDNPRELGADRLVNAVAAFQKYGGPCIVVDLGTAITFDAVSAQAEYLGGVIAPGIGIGIAGLFKKAARLPMIDFVAPARVIGTNTVDNMLSGLYYGTIGMIDGILERMLAEMGPATKVVATGGHAPLIVRGSRYAKEADVDLTLEGLRLIWEMNRAR